MHKRYLTKCLLKGSTFEHLHAFEPRWVRQSCSWSGSKQHSWSLSSFTGGTECRDQGLSAVAVEEMERRIIYTNLHKDWCLTCDTGETLKFLAAFCTSPEEALILLFSQQLHRRSGYRLKITALSFTNNLIAPTIKSQKMEKWAALVSIVFACQHTCTLVEMWHTGVACPSAPMTLTLRETLF